MPRWLADALKLAAVAAVCGALVGFTRPTVARWCRRIKEQSDVYVLPPPEEVVALSLGYRAALADVLWAHVLVSQGLHTQERRRFGNLTRLLDAINELDPQFRDPYQMADALITFQTSETPHDEIVKAREIMERGVKNRPLDGELWLTLGQFVAFIAPASYLEDPAEQKEWRATGVEYLARAAELGGNQANIAWQAVGGAGILTRAGDREATIRFYQRTLATTGDEELKAWLKERLRALMGQQALEAYARRMQLYDQAWRQKLPIASRAMVDALGPPPEPAFCAGGENDGDPRCALTWRAWSEAMEQQQKGSN